MTTMFRYAAHVPNANPLGALTAPVGSSFSCPMNEVSGCTISYMPGTSGAEFLERMMEVSVEASVDGGLTWNEIPNGRYIRVDREYEKVIGGARQYTLKGYGWQLNKAIVWRTDNLNEDGKRPFLSATVGTILKTLIDEAHGRGTIPGLDYDFDTGVDSAGMAWDKVITIYYEPTLSIYSILDNLSQQGMCDWRMQGRTLQVYNADTTMGQDRSASIRLKPGVDIKALPVKASIENLVNKALIIGDEGVTLELQNDSVIMPWGNWETAISNSGVTDPGTMTLLGNALLQDGSSERVQFTCEMKMDTTTFFPFGLGTGGFSTGFYISGPNEEVGGYQNYRVRQINGRSDKNGKFQIDLVVNDRFVEREIRNAKKTNGIVGGASAGGSGGRPTPAPNPGQGQDTRQPAQVLGVTVDSDVFIDHNGRPAGIIMANWAEVSTATNGTALDVVGYQIAVRRGTTGIWSIIATVEDLDWQASPYTPAAVYQVKIRAVGKYTTTPGVWSSIHTITVDSDVTPPSVPSAPVLATRLGVITVTWDGENEVGAEMEADFSHIEIAMGTNANPTSVIDTLDRAGFIPVTDQPYEENRYFRFRSVDTSDNKSEWSVATAIATTSIVDADLVDTTIQESIEEALTGQIDGSRLQPWTVLGDKVLIGDVDNRIPWNPQVSAAPHSPANNTVLSTLNDPEIGWVIQFTGGTGTDGNLNPGIIFKSGTEDGLFVVEPGRSYRIGVHIGADGSFPVARLARLVVAWYDKDGLYAGSDFGPDVTPPFIGTATSSDLFEAPLEAAFCQVEVWKNTWTGTGAYRVYNPYMVLAASAELIVDGAVTADKIAANAVTADKIEANAITADKIDAGAIDGMVITGSTIRTSAQSGRIQMGTDEWYMTDNSGTKQMSVTPGNIWINALMDMRLANLGRGMAHLGGTKLLTMGSTPTSTITGMTPALGAGGLLLVEPMQYAAGTAATRVEIVSLNSGGALGGTNAYLVFGNRNGAGSARHLAVGGTNVDNAAQISVRSQGLIGTEDVDHVSFRMQGDGTPFSGTNSYPNGAAPVISMQRSTSTSWSPTTGVKPMITMAAGTIETYVTGASGFRISSVEGGATNAAGSNPNTVFIANTNGVYLGTGNTGNAANAYIHTDGRLFKSTSARKYKAEIEDLVLDSSTVLQLRPRTWLDKMQLIEDPDSAFRIPGFIAEEVEEAGLGIFVTYKDGAPDGLSYDRISAAHHIVLQNHDARIALLEEENRKLRSLLKKG